MEMNVKLKLKSGREIKLSKEELDELKSFFETERVVQQWFPYTPVNPYIPNQIDQIYTR